MKNFIILSTLMVALSAANALAADANITFNGTVSANTCTLAAADATKVLTIPNVAPAALYTGYLTYNASGSFRFSACPAGLTKVISNYTYQGALSSNGNNNLAIPSGTAANVGLVVMQNSTATAGTVILVNGTSGTNNQTAIASNAATVPVTEGVSSVDTTGTAALPTVGNYTGTYIIAFTYS